MKISSHELLDVLSPLFFLQGKSSPPTMVKLSGVTSMISHGDVQSAIDNIGKTKSVVIFRSKLEVGTTKVGVYTQKISTSIFNKRKYVL